MSIGTPINSQKPSERITEIAVELWHKSMIGHVHGGFGSIEGLRSRAMADCGSYAIAQYIDEQWEATK